MLAQGYVKAVAWILIVVSLAKLKSAYSHSKVTMIYDPVFGLKNKLLYAGVALVEIVIAVYLLSGRNVERKLQTIAWLAANFLIYRGGLLWMRVSEPCICIGNVADWWPCLAVYQRLLTGLILCFLAFGSSGFLVFGKFIKNK
jgi:hypothetical protein